jgi:hypothetical protein
MTRKIVIAAVFIASVGTAQAAPVVTNPDTIKAAVPNNVTPIQWQVWAGRLAWAGVGALAYREWQRHYYGGYGYYGYGPRYGYYGPPRYSHYGPPRYYYGGW